MPFDFAFDLRRGIVELELMEEIMANVEQEKKEIKARMLQRAVERLVSQGTPSGEAHQIALAALESPSKVKLPTIDELDC